MELPFINWPRTSIAMIRTPFTNSRSVASNILWRRSGGAPRRVFCSAKAAKTSDISLTLGLSAGGIAGVLSALTSIGGGIVLIPVIAKLTTLPMQRVNATCYAALTASAGLGAWNYAEAGVVNYPLAIISSLPGMLFTRYGIIAAQRINSKHLASIIGCGMLLTVPTILLKCDSVKKLLPDSMLASSSVSSAANSLDLQYYRAGFVETLQGRPRAREFYDNAVNDPVGFLKANAPYLMAGAVAGFLAGLSGVGGSMITVTYLAIATDMPQSVVVGTTFVSAVPISIPTNYYNFKAKLISFPTALKVGVSLIAGVYGTTAVILSDDMPEDLLRTVFAGIVTVAGVAMIRRPI